MKILFLSYFFEPDLSAGSFRNTSLLKELVRSLSPGDHVDVITTKPNRYDTYSVDVPSVEHGPNYTINRVAVPKNNSGMAGEIMAFRKYYSAVLKLTGGGKYDLVYGSSSKLFTAFLARKVAKKYRAPLYLDIRDIFMEGIEAVFQKHKIAALVCRPCLRYVEKYAFKDAGHINLVSEGFKEYFTKYTKPRYTFFTNGIDDIFLDIRFTPDTVTRYKKVITYAGNMGAGQGLERIIPGLARELGDDYVLHVIGDGKQRAMLEESLQRDGITNVKLENAVGRDKLSEYYENSDFLFLHLNDHPAFERVLPSKLFEYSVYNIPIVAGVKGYAATFLNRELPGSIVFDPGDYATAAKEIKACKTKRVDHRAFVEKFARRTIMKRMVASILSLTQIPHR